MLSGNSLRNRDWIKVVDENFKSLFNKTYVQSYAHWEGDQPWINLMHEKSVLKSAAETYEPYGILAKSIGSVLTIQSIKDQIVKPHFLLLLGLPLDFIEESYTEFVRDLFSFKGPVVIIQNQHDPMGSIERVKAYLGDALPPNITLHVLPGDTHSYEDYPFIEAQLNSLLELTK